MKQQLSLSKKIFQYFLMMVLMLVSAAAPAQEDSTAQEPAAGEPELISPLVEFVSVQKADKTVDLKATFKAKIEGTLTKLSGLKIEFFSGSDTTEKKIAEAVTDPRGVAVINVKENDLVLDTGGRLNFKVTYAGNDKMESAEEVLSIKRGRLEIVPVKEDSLLTVQLKFIDLSTGAEVPIPETDLGVYVKRLFNPLKVGEGKTDEEGLATIEIPNNLPGDEKGNIILIGKVEDNEDYGNLEATVTQTWGKPVSNEFAKMPRTLWSATPPLWMLITFIVLMGTVWGHYIVIIWELVRLRKEPA